MGSATLQTASSTSAWGSSRLVPSQRIKPQKHQHLSSKPSDVYENMAPHGRTYSPFQPCQSTLVNLCTQFIQLGTFLLHDYFQYFLSLSVNYQQKQRPNSYYLEKKEMKGSYLTYALPTSTVEGKNLFNKVDRQIL